MKWIRLREQLHGVLILLNEHVYGYEIFFKYVCTF